MPSLKTDDIPGAKPKKTAYDKRDIVCQYNAKMTEKQQDELKLQNSRSLNYWQFPTQKNFPSSKSFLQLKDALYSNPGQLTERAEAYGSYNPAENLQTTSSLFSPRNFQQAYSPKMRNPMFSDFNYTKSERPTQSNNQAGNIFIGDSLDVLKYQVEGKNQSGNNDYYEQSSSGENPLNRDRRDNNLGGGSPNLQLELAKNYEQYAKIQDQHYSSPERQNEGLKHSLSRSDYIVFNPLTQSPMMRYQNSPKKIEIPKVGEEWKFQANASKFFT
jgi:hypothetical protein